MNELGEVSGSCVGSVNDQCCDKSWWMNSVNLTVVLRTAGAALLTTPTSFARLSAVTVGTACIDFKWHPFRPVSLFDSRIDASEIIFTSLRLYIAVFYAQARARVCMCLWVCVVFVVVGFVIFVSFFVFVSFYILVGETVIALWSKATCAEPDVCFWSINRSPPSTLPPPSLPPALFTSCVTGPAGCKVVLHFPTTSSRCRPILRTRNNSASLWWP